MSSLAAFMGFLVTVLAMFVLRPVAVEMGLVDIPGGRKRHDDRIPLIGGLAMCVGTTFGVSLGELPDVWTPIALAMYLLVVVGTVDDRFDLPATVRLIAQTCAALLVVLGAGIIAQHLGRPIFWEVSLGAFAIPFTVLFVLTLINAFNMIDGLDGLAGGLAFIALCSLATLSIGTSLFTLVVVLLAVVTGFLLFNLPVRFNRRGRAFMGDAGSTFIGLSIAVIGVALSQGDGATITPIVGLWFVAVPVFDLFSAIYRRVSLGRSPFSPDAEHLHHKLVAHGLSRTETLLVMWAIALCCAGLGLIAHYAVVEDGIMTIAWLCAGFAYYRFMRRPMALVRAVKHVTRSWPVKTQTDIA